MSQRDDELQEVRDLETDLVALLDITPGLAARTRRRNGWIAAMPIALLIGGLSTGAVQMDGSLWATSDSETAGRPFTMPNQMSHDEPARAPDAGREIALTTPAGDEARDIGTAEAPRAEAREPTRAGSTPKHLLAARDRPSTEAMSRPLPSKTRREQFAVATPRRWTRESTDREYTGPDRDGLDDDEGYDDDRRDDRGAYRRGWRDADRGYDRDAESDAYRRLRRGDARDYDRDAEGDDYGRRWRDEDRGYGRGEDDDYRRHWRDQDRREDD